MNYLRRFFAVIITILVCNQREWKFVTGDGTGVPCHHCSSTLGKTKCFGDCWGEMCFIEENGLGGVVSQGCLSGVGNGAKGDGCQGEQGGNYTLCLCSAAHCNSREDNQLLLEHRQRSPATKMAGQRQTCSNYSIVNDAKKYENQCEGHRCYFRLETFEELPGKMRKIESGGCQRQVNSPAYYPLLTRIPHFTRANACFTIQEGSRRKVTDCVCNNEGECPLTSHSENDEANRKRNKGKKTISCEMSAHSMREKTVSNRGSVCHGEICYIVETRIRAAPGFQVTSFRKGCLNSSMTTGAEKGGSTEVDVTFLTRVGERSVEEGVKLERVWTCESPRCNRNRRAAVQSIQRSNGAKPLPFNSRQKINGKQKHGDNQFTTIPPIAIPVTSVDNQMSPSGTELVVTAFTRNPTTPFYLTTGNNIPLGTPSTPTRPIQTGRTSRTRTSYDIVPLLPNGSNSNVFPFYTCRQSLLLHSLVLPLLSLRISTPSVRT